MYFNKSFKQCVHTFCRVRNHIGFINQIAHVNSRYQMFVRQSYYSDIKILRFPDAPYYRNAGSRTIDVVKSGNCYRYFAQISFPSLIIIRTSFPVLLRVKELPVEGLKTNPFSLRAIFSFIIIFGIH